VQNSTRLLKILFKNGIRTCKDDQAFLLFLNLPTPFLSYKGKASTESTYNTQREERLRGRKPIPATTTPKSKVIFTFLVDKLKSRWVAKLAARLLTTAALWVRIQISLKNTKWAT
jgi:hypothetical protein